MRLSRMGIVSAAVLGVLLSVVAMAVQAQEKKVSPAERAALLAVAEGDVALGAEDAPVTMIEYASLSCGHCATFHNDVYPVLKERFVDTGKLRFVFRHFPLNEPALRGSLLVNCVAAEKQESFLRTLFKAQDKWAFDRGFLQNLKNIARVGGMKEADFDACMVDADQEKALLEGRLKASQVLGVSSTPTFFINGEMFKGHKPEQFISKIESLLD